MTSAPPVPTGLSPGGSSPPGTTVNTLTPTLTWNTSAGAAAYSVSVSQVGGGKVGRASGRARAELWAAVETGTNKTWAVSGSHSAGSSAKSAVAYFTDTMT